jgi:hypothetical protein
MARDFQRSIVQSSETPQERPVDEAVGDVNEAVADVQVESSQETLRNLGPGSRFRNPQDRRFGVFQGALIVDICCRRRTARRSRRCSSARNTWTTRSTSALGDGTRQVIIPAAGLTVVDIDSDRPLNVLFKASKVYSAFKEPGRCLHARRRRCSCWLVNS